MNFKLGDKVTTVGINGAAITVKDIFTIDGKDDAPVNRYFGRLPKEKKQRYLPEPMADRLFFMGEIPYKVDSETGRFCGNAMINFIADQNEREALRTFLKEKNINDRFECWDLITVQSRSARDEDEAEILFAQEIA